MSLRRGLERSKNMISIRILQAIGAPYAQQWVTRFGFEAEKHPAYLPMALGTGSVTPLQMATAYSVFANGGYRLNPLLISKITDTKGRALNEAQVATLDESMRTLDARNAFVMDSLLQSVAARGTAAAAQRSLARTDLYGKTGTTNDSIDTWFAGFQPTMTAIAWMGYDAPRSLGDKETGSSLSLPIWISYMETAIKGVPVTEIQAPEGVVHVGGEWYYDEYAPGSGLANWGMAAPAPAEAGPTPKAESFSDERSRILDMFRN